MLEITARVWEGTDYLPHVLDSWLADPNATLEVAELDGVVVGFQRLRPITQRIVLYEGLRVAEEHRRRGVARAMLRHALEEGSGQGFGEMRLITGNPAACGLFDAEGFHRLVHCQVWLAGRVEGVDLPRLVAADEAAALFARLRADPAYDAYGRVNAHWQDVSDLDEELLGRLAEEGLVRASGGGRALALLEPRPHNRLAASLVAGSGAALQDLLMGLRFEADSQGYEGVRLFAPVPHPASDDFAEVGYHLADGQVQRYAYARELTG
ncbi:MAG: GNAT family N-acetyltransferase [Candidatus Dormibacteraeota bacterium]|nr:GNAT family N-acetyltransferase [Candidatus Dormibacteraeota bacterium]